MAEELLLAIGEGRLSIASAGRIAEARCDEGGADADTQALAACADKNGERYLERWLLRQPWRRCMPEPYNFDAPMLRKGVRRTGEEVGRDR